MPDKTNFNGRLNGIQAMPETFFVDSNGNIVGDTYSGAKSAKEWKQVIEKELEKIKINKSKAVIGIWLINF